MTHTPGVTGVRAGTLDQPTKARAWLSFPLLRQFSARHREASAMRSSAQLWQSAASPRQSAASHRQSPSRRRYGEASPSGGSAKRTTPAARQGQPRQRCGMAWQPVPLAEQHAATAWLGATARGVAMAEHSAPEHRQSGTRRRHSLVERCGTMASHGQAVRRRRRQGAGNLTFSRTLLRVASSRATLGATFV